jgi:hypothetical protein
MKKVIAVLVSLASLVAAPVAFARAGTLVSCDFVSTQNGARYIGTYCVDYACSYTTTRVFTSYCPFSIR